MEDNNVKELLIVMEFIESIFLSHNIDNLIQKSADFLMNKFRLSNCTIILNDKKYRFYSSSGVDNTYAQVEDKLYNAIKELKTALVISSLKSDFLTKSVKNIDKTPQCCLAIPIITGKELIGIICLYSEEEMKYLLDITTTISQKLEKAALMIKRYDEARHSADTDPLTGLYNRAYTMQFLERTIDQLSKEKKPTSLIMFDIDNFKAYNDTQGHLEGDKILRKIAEIVKQSFRSQDIISRYGGEEFMIVLPETDAKVSKERAEEFCRAVFSQSGLSVSIGLLTCMNSSLNSQEIIKQADNALYKAKRTGKNKTVQFIVVDKSLGVIDTVEAGKMGR